MRGAHADRGLRLIATYKLVKAVVQLGLAIALVVLAATGEIERLRELARHLRHDFTGRWALLLGRALGALVSVRGARVLELALALDAGLSAVEGWALWRGRRWAEWLVVVATALPLPVEAEELVRHPRPWRVAVALLNVAIVLYLAWRLRRGR